MLDELKKIKQMRQKLGLTQAQLAGLAGVSQSTITKIERETIEPSYSLARKIFFTLEQELANVQQEMTAKDICSKKIISVKSNDKLDTAMELMKKHAISQMPVVKDNAFVGSISEETFIREYDKIKSKKIEVEQVMDESFPTISENMPISLIRDILKEYSAIIVVKRGKPVGIISRADLLRKA